MREKEPIPRSCPSCETKFRQYERPRPRPMAIAYLIASIGIALCPIWAYFTVAYLDYQPRGHGLVMVLEVLAFWGWPGAIGVGIATRFPFAATVKCNSCGWKKKFLK